MKDLGKQLRRYPLIAVFFAFISLLALVDFFMPDKERSEYENRKLLQKPAFDLVTLMENEWTGSYGEYMKDQFFLRDSWISLQSLLETAQGKLEANGVWYAKDGYQIAKLEFFTGEMEQRLATNTAAAAQLAARWPGQVTAMIVPSPGFVMQDRLRWSPPQIEEDAILDGVFDALNGSGAGTIDLRGVYAGREAEYLFYRTDHHWTTTGGAWLAYEAFCESVGMEPVKPVAELRERDDFYGTNYAKTKRIGTAPDTLSWYDVPNTLTVYNYAADGTLNGQAGPVMETEKLEEYDKYAAFLRGNNGYSVLEGDGEGRILVIKDSYGNSFVPYLVANYAQIGIIDLRTWTGTVDGVIEEGGYEEILVLYCFESFSTDVKAYRMGDDSQ